MGFLIYAFFLSWFFFLAFLILVLVASTYYWFQYPYATYKKKIGFSTKSTRLVTDAKGIFFNGKPIKMKY